SVDLPQPEGPTRTQNSPSSIATSMPRTTSVEPKDLRTCLSATLAMLFFALLGGHLFYPPGWPPQGIGWDADRSRTACQRGTISRASDARRRRRCSSG